MDCPICYKIIENSCIGSCVHHYCYSCLIKWCKFGGTTCPICSETINEIRFDKEFDSINNPSSNNNLVLDYLKIVNIDFKEPGEPGITIENNNDNIGVKVKKINKNDLCYKGGIKKNDIILYINNVPCINHNQTVNIIKNCFNNKKKCKFHLLI